MIELDPRLNSFDGGVRAEALERFAASSSGAQVRDAVNLHCHTFYSFNAHGLSPTGVACLMQSLGVRAAGIVDFDVLDGVEEFLGAARRLDLPACAGIETRVFVPELAAAEINSPGEPGIAYHMGVGFVRARARDGAFLARLKRGAQERNRGILERVNAHLHPIVLDFEQDVLPLTPAGNPTERHLCAGYDAQARAVVSDESERAAFWAEKLGMPAGEVRAMMDDAAIFQNTLRRVLMKRGDVGYVQPDSAAFPRLDEFNRFVAGEGAIPTVAWLDGCSDGERDAGALLDLHMAQGALALNIIPDRNWNLPDDKEKQRKVANLGAIVEGARSRGLPIFVGTEMNAPGQPDVDDFEARELAPYVNDFLAGAAVACAHTERESSADLGYVNERTIAEFPEIEARRAHFLRIGERMFGGVRTGS